MAKTTWSPSELLHVEKGFDLSTVDPDGTPGFDSGKKEGKKALAASAVELADVQERLFADSRAGGTRSVLLVLQAMDTAGKGGIVRHAFAGVDPQGIETFGFKAPTEKESEHDFLWRVRPHLPGPGLIGVFDRSHYEDVLIHRVRRLSTRKVIAERYGLIKDFEAEIVASGTTLIKVMLHISADEQKDRLAERLDRADKLWKFNPGDVDERELWQEYQEAYQIALARTSTVEAPWFVVPANHKWYARLAVQHLVLDALRSFDLGWPAPDYDVDEQKARLAAS